jgi:hypothetical protein
MFRVIALQAYAEVSMHFTQLFHVRPKGFGQALLLGRMASSISGNRAGDERGSKRGHSDDQDMVEVVEVKEKRPDNRTCRFCLEPTPYRMLAAHIMGCAAAQTVTIAYAQEKKMQPLGMSPATPPPTTLQSRVAIAVVGGMSKELGERFLMLMQVAELFWSDQPSTRPDHRGHLKAVGYCHRFMQKYKLNFNDTEALVESIGYFLEDWINHSPLVNLYNDMVEPRVEREMVDMICKSFKMGRPDAPNAFIGKSYVPVQHAEGHAPPPPVARLLRVPACVDSCQQCAISCLQCSACPMRKDVNDQGPTILFQYLHGKVHGSRLRSRVYFVIDDTAYEITAGFCAVFNAAKVAHGAWAPEGVGGFFGLAVVNRHRAS